MIKALKVTLIVAAVVSFVFGVMLLVVPDQFARIVNFTGFPDEGSYILGLLGAMYVMWAVGAGIASRDPARHKSWVQAGLLSYGLSLIMTIYYLASGTIVMSQATIGLIVQIVFLVALAVLYPRQQAE